MATEALEPTVAETSTATLSCRCSSYSTAAVILPPSLLHERIDILRSVYDKSYPRWAPHITMAIPFVAPSVLPVAVERIQTLFREQKELVPHWHISLDKTGVFRHKDSATVYLKPDDESISRLRKLRNALNTIFDLPSTGDGEFHPHLTIGQTALDDSVLHLQEKAEMLLPISWDASSLFIILKNEIDAGRMEVFASIPERTKPNMDGFVFASSQASLPCCYTLDNSSKGRDIYRPAPSLFNLDPPISRMNKMTISTYNILHSPLQPQTSSSPRLPVLLNTILDQSSTVIILQEVTDTALQYFLSHPPLRQKYLFCSAPSNLHLPNHRNIVALSTIPFKARHLPLVTPHKPALIIDFDSVIIAGVHLHAGLHEEKLSIKLKELSKLTTYLESLGKPVIIAGDFNIPSIQREYTAALPKIHEILDRYSDAWKEKPCMDGDTFTPDTNRFAKEGAKMLYPQRHDRVYISKGVGIHVEKTSLFGIPKDNEELGSDHWGLSVVFRIDLNERTDPDEKTEVTSLDVPSTSWTDKALLQVLMAANQIPGPDNQIYSAFALLDEIMAGARNHFPLKLQIVGSFALGAHTNGGDLDIMAVSSISPKTFWEVFLQRIKDYKNGDPNNNVKVLRIIRDAKTPMVELLVNSYRVEVVYCSACKLLPVWSKLSELPPSSDLFQLPAPTLDVLLSHRDNIAILASVPNVEIFRLARRAFKYFCCQQGIYGAKFGFLGGFAVTMLIAGICKSLPADTSASQIVAKALSHYSSFPWDSEVLWFPGVEKTNVNRESRAAMYIPSITRPSHNIMRNASRSTMSTIRRELSIAKDKLSTTSFNQLCNDGLADFFTRYKNFIKIQCAFWGSHSAEGRKWISWVESRLVVLLVNLSNEFPSLEIRLWPGRFGDMTSDEVQGTYVAGVTGTGIDEGMFRNVLREVERMMKGDETEVVDRWVSITLSRGKDIVAEKLQIDTRILEGEEEINLDEETEEDNDDDDDETVLPPVSKLTVSDVKTGKLRPSHDVFNRLFWDERYAVEDYLVGYEDRFKGVKEMVLASWKRECTDEEFIPFHRVVYFREKGVDGKIIWDRRTRIDLIFGSGQIR